MAARGAFRQFDKAWDEMMNSIVLKMSAAAIAGSMMLSVAACSSDVGPNEAGGTAVGAVAGAAIGSAFGSGSGKLAAIGVGALFGGLLGHEIGKQMDERDRQRALQAQAMAYTAPVGTKVVWTNPDNGHSGSVVPVRDSTDANGNYCREFQETVTIGGQPQQAYGQACRQPDGSWKVVQ